MLRKSVERLSHVPISQVPGVHSALKHSPEIFFGVSYEPGVLFSREEIVLGDWSVPVEIVISPSLQIPELPNNSFLTGLRQIESGRVTIRLFDLAKMIETGVAIT